MRTFSFLDVHMTIAGPGGIVAMGSGAGAADEGITCEFLEDADKMVVGADGKGMHSLNGSKAGKMTVRLLKTSPINGLLTNMMNFQRLSSLNWGKNVVTLTDIARGDVYGATEVAFVKHPTNAYGKEAGMLEWEFNAVQMDAALAIGT